MDERNEAERESADEAVRRHLLELLAGRSAHLDFDAAVAGMPWRRAGERPEGAAHSVWQLVEHLRAALWDLVEFSRDPQHESPPWPEGYWPVAAAPAGEEDWEASLAAYRRHLGEMREMVADRGRDLFAPFSWGDGQTLAREAMLAADHAAYHLGQVVQVRRLIGEWPSG
jgi:hypothetical protein